MANFSLGKADILRKAMAKKQVKLLVEMEKAFIEGCIKNGHDEKLAQEIYDLIKKFAGYGFNKAHSIAYGLLAYQMAYLKANYPLPFYVNLLNGSLGNQKKTSEYVDECRKKNIGLLYPSVLYPSESFEIEKDMIRFPISAIKGIPSMIAKSIANEKAKNSFKDFFDFVARMSLYKLNQKQFEALIDAGALDDFGINRTTMRNSLQDALSYSDLIKVEVQGQIQIDLDLISPPMIQRFKDDKFEIAKKEKEALGLNLGSNPIVEIKKMYNINVYPLSKLKDATYINKGFAQVVKVKQHRTKTGKLMAFVVVSDETSFMDLVVMPKLYAIAMNYLANGNYLFFSGKKDGEDSCLVDKIELFNKEVI
ncbi:MAG: hypothetical protein MR210_02905 [Erysipelotrichaceae bacterium]|nr:hypothetical protein [Erysipelotrichaceae bacterium]